jgi:DNA gyrase/topoisomerase IV subunit B
MYIGAVHVQAAPGWVYDVRHRRMVKKEALSSSPGLLKLFDEILVNACDVKARGGGGPVGAEAAAGTAAAAAAAAAAGTMTRLEVEFRGPGGKLVPPSSAGLVTSISVFNDGRGIPVALHPTEKVYVPDLVFGHLLTGSNFGGEGAGAAAGKGGKGAKSAGASADSSSASSSSSSSAAATGGQHGYGAKLTNIFSTSFTVETADPERGLLYRQTWTDNMSKRGEPVLSPLPKGTASYTRITFTPDTARFGLGAGGGAAAAGIDAGTVALMRRRVVDAAGVLGPDVTVTLDGHAVPVNSFEGYARLYMPHPKAAAGAAAGAVPSVPGGGLVPDAAAKALSVVHHLRVNPRLEIAVSAAGLRVDSAPPASPSSDSAAAAPAASPSKWTAAELESYNAPTAVSFVNGMHTARGGTHVAILLDALSRQLAEHIARRVRRGDFGGGGGGSSSSSSSSSSKEDPSLRVDPAAVTPALVRSHLRLFASVRMSSPSFDSQSKEQLVSVPEAVAAALAGSASSSFDFPDKFVRAVAEEGSIAAAVVGTLQSRTGAELARIMRRATRGSDSKIRSIPKLEDANWAGGKRAHDCTLILTEGDSAKALAVAGLAVVGRDAYGVFPLRGKLLNVRDVGMKVALGNAEVSALVAILGLDFTKTYAGLRAQDRGLRYGRVMIMADQDVDGSHIKGLLVNLFHTYWPRLLEGPGPGGEGTAGGGGGGGGSSSFLEQFLTPIIKARQGDVVREFFSLRDFEAWRAGASIAVPAPVILPAKGAAATAASAPPSSPLGTVFTPVGEALKGKWASKYYKGLGTSTSAEGRAYFSALTRHRKSFVWGGAGDGDSIAMAFTKDRVEDRKAWIAASSSLIAPGEVEGGHGRDAAVPAAKAGRAAGAAATRGEAADHAPSSSSSSSSASVSFSSFINSDLLDFSLADLARSIPSVLDGLKPSQRKVLFACFRRAGGSGSGGALATGVNEGAIEDDDDGPAAVAVASAAPAPAPRAGSSSASLAPPLPPSPPPRLGSEIKVAQLSGYVAEHTAYHHGEAALTATIVGMAQDFVGSNNLPLLQPLGQFGTRLQGGKDAASARYIFTRLAPLARLLFPAVDDDLLVRRDDDGQLVEPVSFVPTIPLVLCNGAQGIATGWSTTIPLHNPVDVVDAVRMAIKAGWADGSAAAAAGKSTKRAGTTTTKRGATAAGVADGSASAAAAAPAAPPSAADADLPGPAPFELRPWWHGFVGEVEARPDGYVTHGIVRPERAGPSSGAAAAAGGGDAGGDAGSADVSSSPSRGGGGSGDGLTFRVLELPVGRWTEDYKAMLQELMAAGEVRTFREYHTESRVDFLVTLTKDAGAAALCKAGYPTHLLLRGDGADSDGEADAETLGKGPRGRGKKGVPAAAAAEAAAAVVPPPKSSSEEAAEALRRYFRLSTSISTRNMHLFDPFGRIRRYASPWQVIADFLPVRLGLYEARRAKLEGLLAEAAVRARAKARFLEEVTSGRLVVGKRPRAELVADLAARGYPPLGAGGLASVPEEAPAVAGGAAAASSTLTPPKTIIGPHVDHLLAAPLLDKYRRSSLLEAAGAAGAAVAPAAAQKPTGAASGPGSVAGVTGAAPLPPPPRVASFDYLLSLPLWQLSSESLARAVRAATETAAALERVRGTTALSMWEADLTALRAALVGAGASGRGSADGAGAVGEGEGEGEGEKGVETGAANPVKKPKRSGSAASGKARAAVVADEELAAPAAVKGGPRKPKGAAK